VGRLAAGTNGKVLTADSGEPAGVKWSPYGIASLDIGTVGTGSPAAADVTGNPEDGYELNLTLPPVGANGVNTAAIQNGAVTAEKIANLVPLSFGVAKWLTYGFEALTTDAQYVTLGVDPDEGSVMVYVQGLARVPGVDFTVAGREIVIASVSAGDTVLIRYADSLSQDYTAPVRSILYASFAGTGAGLGTAETGHTFTASPVDCAWSRDSDKAYLSTPKPQCIAITDIGVADYTITAEVTAQDADGTYGLSFRAVDYTNFLLVGGYNLAKVVNGTATPLIPISPNLKSGDAIRVVASGSSITLYIKRTGAADFVQVGSTVTETFNQTATKVGLRARTNDTGRIDSLRAVI